MRLIETKGTVKFYVDKNGVQFQKIEHSKLIPVVDGDIQYMHIKNVGDYSIQYNLNGVYGFAITSILTGAVLETEYWDIEEATQTALSFGGYAK